MTSVSHSAVAPGRNVSAKPFLVVSDLHLGAVPEAREHQFRELLRYAADNASGLLINGDLFDVWLASRHFVVRRHVRVLAALADLADAGVPVYVVGGNHDPLELGRHALEDFGAIPLTEPARLQLGAWRALVIHGDGVLRDGASYPRYVKRHPLLRSATFRWAAERLLHLDRIYDRVDKWSTTSRQVARHLRGEDAGPKPDAAPIAAWAMAALRAEPATDIVLAGHSHSPAVVDAGGGRYYVNSGDWISHMIVVVLPADRGAPELRVWPDGMRDVGAP